MTNQTKHLRERVQVQLRNCVLALAAALALSGAAAAQNASTTHSDKGKPLATLNGDSIYEDQLQPQVRNELEKLDQQETTLKAKAIESLIVQRIVEAKAKEKGETVGQFLEAEVDSKVADPTDAEVNAYYLARQDQINQPLDEVRDQLRQALKNAMIQQAHQAYAKDLLAEGEQSGNIVILFHQPLVDVSFDPARVRGNSNTPVMIVEFADFSCPYCKKAEASLKEVLAKYPDKVSLSFRDYPLRDIHPEAEIAAEAARCAGEQGRFWEYHDLLYGGTDHHDRDNLVLDARVLQLDEKRFESCLDSGKYKAQIDKDLEDGAKAGVIGTPGFFVDGVFLDGAQPPAAFDRIIDEELAKPNPKHPAN